MSSNIAKRVPANARQHITAGPYSPVMEIVAQRIAVISGQVSVDPDGNVLGDTVVEQTAATLENCKRQLATAGYGMEDVFKVNVYLADIADWDAFNSVYRDAMPSPLPVRTAIQCGLLEGFRVELEMWAAK